jgi:hypothetical protein
MEKCYIATIYFAGKTADRSIYGKTYNLPEVPVGGEPFLLEITDVIQRSQGAYSLGTGREAAATQGPDRGAHDRG